jgi:shikimate kinase
VPGNPRGRLRAMLEERRPLYEQLAVVTIGTDGLSPEEIALKIANEQQIAADAEHSR